MLHCISVFDDIFNVPTWILNFADTMVGTLSNRKWSFTNFKKKKKTSFYEIFLYGHFLFFY